MTNSFGSKWSLGLFWAGSLLILYLTQVLATDVLTFDAGLLEALLFKSLIPVGICAIVVTLLLVSRSALPAQGVLATTYILFFTISVTSLLGLTKTLTGSHAESSNAVLYGVSFYTASLAYLTHTGNVRPETSLLVSNPLLLITGPIATAFGDIRYRAFRKRLSYYLPFVIVGLFLHQAVATPLTQTFSLIEKTDLVSSVVFAAIFELFVYANFCGLSLIIYGACGIAGFRIPLNFKQPFSSTNVIDYWRGWHLSLSTVLKSLFYLPGKRQLGTTGALFTVYLASAMWHGVTFNFILWGLFHAAAFVITIRLLKRDYRFFALTLGFFALLFGRMLFTDSDTSRLLEKLQFHYSGTSALAYLENMPGAVQNALYLGLVFVFLEFVLQWHRISAKRNYKLFRLPVVQFAILAVTLMTLSKNMGIDYAVYGQR